MNIFDEAMQRYLEEGAQYSISINNLERTLEENNHKIGKLKTSMLTTVISVKNKLVAFLILAGVSTVALSKIVETSLAILAGTSIGGAYFIGSLARDVIADYKNKKANKEKETEVERLEKENEDIKKEISHLRRQREEKVGYARRIQHEKARASLDLLEEYYPYQSKEHSDRILMKLLKSDK